MPLTSQITKNIPKYHPLYGKLYAVTPNSKIAVYKDVNIYEPATIYTSIKDDKVIKRVEKEYLYNNNNERYGQNTRVFRNDKIVRQVWNRFNEKTPKYWCTINYSNKKPEYELEYNYINGRLKETILNIYDKAKNCLGITYRPNLALNKELKAISGIVLAHSNSEKPVYLFTSVNDDFVPEYIKTEVSKHFNFSTPINTTQKHTTGNYSANLQIEENKEINLSQHFADKFKKLLLIT